jgi:predicted nucleic acid-binding protein
MPDIISNTSCLIILTNIGQLDLLHSLYGSIVITPEVAAEYDENLPEWIQVKTVQDTDKIKMLQNSLDLGEASTIALALEMPEHSIIILDDKKARRAAKDFGLHLTGTLGVISKAYKAGIIPDISKIMNDLHQSNFRIPKNFERLILQ